VNVFAVGGALLIGVWKLHPVFVRIGCARQQILWSYVDALEQECANCGNPGGATQSFPSTAENAIGFRAGNEAVCGSLLGRSLTQGNAR
jgi:hypothetical protein